MNKRTKPVNMIVRKPRQKKPVYTKEKLPPKKISSKKPKPNPKPPGGRYPTPDTRYTFPPEPKGGYSREHPVPIRVIPIYDTSRIRMKPLPTKSLRRNIQELQLKKLSKKNVHEQKLRRMKPLPPDNRGKGFEPIYEPRTRYNRCLICGKQKCNCFLGR